MARGSSAGISASVRGARLGFGIACLFIIQHIAIQTLRNVVFGASFCTHSADGAHRRLSNDCIHHAGLCHNICHAIYVNSYVTKRLC